MPPLRHSLDPRHVSIDCETARHGISPLLCSLTLLQPYGRAVPTYGSWIIHCPNRTKHPSVPLQRQATVAKSISSTFSTSAPTLAVTPARHPPPYPSRQSLGVSPTAHAEAHEGKRWAGGKRRRNRRSGWRGQSELPPVRYPRVKTHVVGRDSESHGTDSAPVGVFRAARSGPLRQCAVPGVRGTMHDNTLTIHRALIGSAPWFRAGSISQSLCPRC